MNGEPCEIRVLLSALRTAAGGNAVYAHELARGLDARDDVRLAIATNTADAPRWREIAPQADVLATDLPRAPMRIGAERRALLRAVRGWAPSLVHDPVTLLPFLRPSVPAVVTVADLNFEQLAFGVARTAYKRLLYAHAARHADLLVCMSEFTRTTLCRHYARARAKSRVVWCGHAFGHTEMPDAPAAAASAPFLLTFAHRPHKNAEVAVRILARLRESEPAFRLVVVGAGATQKESVLRLARELSVEGAVDVPPRVDDAELRRLYREASCLVFLSRYEGFGLPALEAMALGCPVVVSDRAALPEIVAGHAPVLDCEDWRGAAAHVARLRADSALRRGLCERARTYALQWTWTRMVDETVRAYRELLAAREALTGAAHA